MPTFLEDTTTEVNRLAALEAAAGRELATAQAAQAAAKSRLDEAQKKQSEADKALAAVRKVLGNVEVAPGADNGGEELRKALVNLRKVRGDVLAAKLDGRTANDGVVQAKAGLDAVRAALVRARAAQTKAKARADKFEAWRSALATPPLSTLADDAKALRTGDKFKTAEAKVKASLPERLRKRAKERLVHAQDADKAHKDLVLALGSLADKLTADTGGASGPVTTLERALARADAQLFEFVSLGATRLRQAESLLDGILARPTIDRPIRSALDSNAARNAAADAEAKRDAATQALADKRRQREELVASLKTADADADVDADPNVNAVNAEIAAAETALKAADAAFDDAMRNTMAQWQADVPSGVWADLHDLALVESSLKSLPTTADLVRAVTDAEAALVAALAAGIAVQRRLDLTASSVSSAAAAIAQDDATASERHRAALEGLR